MTVRLLLACVLLVSACRAAPPAADVDHARAYLDALAGTIGSRPVGSPENVKARQYLVSELERLGFVVRLQDTVGVDPGRGLTAPVTNIIARKDGSQRDAIALISHFDSVPEAMGALDDGIGVVACLESARALVAAPLRHSLFVIITDAEEFGLLGARAAVKDAEVVERVRGFLNFDGTGAAGPALLFETAPGLGASLEAWAAGAAVPEGASFTTEIYKRLPNDTDFSVFKRLNASGLNFAAVGDSYAYHTDRDVTTRVSTATLQHVIANTISTVRAIDARELTAEPAAAPTYFDLLGRGAVVYGPTTSNAIAIVAVVVAILGWLRLTRQLWRQRGFLGLLMTTLWTVVTAAGSVAAMIGAAWMLRALRPELSPWYSAPEWFFYLAATSGVAGAWLIGRIAGVAPLALRPLREPAATWWCAVPLWIGVAILLQRSAPTAAYLVTLPLLAAAALTVATATMPRLLRLGSAAVLVVAAFFGLGDLARLLTFMVPLFGWLPVLAPLWLYPAVLAAAGLLVAPPAAAMLAGLSPRTLSPMRVGTVLAAAIVVIGFRALSVPAYTADRPERRLARYIQDDVKGEAWWEIGGLESAPNLAGAGPDGARWQRATDAPATSVRLSRLLQPFVFRTPGSLAATPPADVHAALKRTATDGIGIELTIVPHENLVAQIVLPPGLAPSESSLTGVVSEGQWSATYVAPPASGLTVKITFDRWSSPDPPQILIALNTVGLPGGTGRLKLPPWLPQGTATWRPRSVFISAARYE